MDFFLNTFLFSSANGIERCTDAMNVPKDKSYRILTNAVLQKDCRRLKIGTTSQQRNLGCRK